MVTDFGETPLAVIVIVAVDGFGVGVGVGVGVEVGVGVGVGVGELGESLPPPQDTATSATSIAANREARNVGIRKISSKY